NYEAAEDRAIHPGSLVAPGSTIKPLTVLIGLNEGLITANTTYRDTGVFQFGQDRSKVHNSDGHPYGMLNPVTAIGRSSNTFMAAKVGNELYMQLENPIEVWDQYMEQFGLGVLTGSGLPGESAGEKTYIDARQTGRAQASMVYASFGQGARYTALQLAQYCA